MYGGGNPITSIDSTGESPAVIAGAIVGGIAGWYGASISGGNVVKGTVFGAVSGAFLGAVGPVIVGSVAANVLVRVGAGAVGNALGQLQNVHDSCYPGFNWGSFIGSAVGGGLSGVLSPGGWGTPFTGPFAAQVGQRALSGIPAASVSSTAAIVGTKIGEPSNACSCNDR